MTYARKTLISLQDTLSDESEFTSIYERIRRADISRDTHRSRDFGWIPSISWGRGIGACSRLALLVGLRRSAPAARIAVHQAGHARMFKQLESGTIDVALIAMDATPDHLHRRVLYTEHYVLVARNGHPALKRKLTLERFCKLDHVLVSPEGGGFSGKTDTVLEARGRSRRVVLSTQHFPIPARGRRADGSRGAGVITTASRSDGSPAGAPRPLPSHPTTWA